MNYPYNNVLRSLIFIIACLFQVGAHAEAKVGDRFGEWVFECHAIAADKTICALSQMVSSKENSKLRAKLSLRNDKSKGDPELIAMVPLGIYLPSGVTGTFDQGRPFQFTVQRCTRQNCMASVKADSVLLKTMQSSERIAISFTGQVGDKPMVVSGPLKGLAEGLKAINLK